MNLRCLASGEELDIRDVVNTAREGQRNWGARVPDFILIQHTWDDSQAVSEVTRRETVDVLGRADLER